MILIDVDGCRYVVLDAWHEQDDQNALAPTETGLRGLLFLAFRPHRSI